MTGPETGGPPTKSGIDLTLRVPGQQVAERIRLEATAWSAGANSTSAAPLSAEKRSDNYQRQNDRRGLTAAQRRRDAKKQRRAAFRLAIAE
ncbi:hypothetical protein [Micromonospora inyonensis]|uniref:Uncharacterized protein n=1 Tax=Micromonospora inyonensis TaxID=47866 RepID=A0A1C6RDJ0_9ACTN|nr:hypothetical protein [Micromonospora inyonensis]SCL15113.1 hypothetical protein GA0074694_1060 [Micromonospora inyonensis]SCL33409.1 hypothetical protein GA0074694_6220 [Micromonospora inyonensis]